MKVVCPHCNVPMDLSEVVAGTNIKCATCNEEFVAGESPPPPAATTADRVPCPICKHKVAAGAIKCPNCKGAIGTTTCPSCRESIPSNAVDCPLCQTQIKKVDPVPVKAPQPQRICPSCRNQFPSHVAFCQNCKVPLGPTPQSKILCALLALIVPFGVHRFLMGYTTIGIIQVLVVTVTCGAGCIWPFIEGFLILAGSLKMSDGQDLLES